MLKSRGESDSLNRNRQVWPTSYGIVILVGDSKSFDGCDDGFGRANMYDLHIKAVSAPVSWMVICYRLKD